LNLNFGGSGDFPNFLFQDTLYFGILLTSLGASWFKKQANRPLLIKNKTRSAARRKEEQEKRSPRDFQWGVSGTAHHKPPTGLRRVLVERLPKPWITVKLVGVNRNRVQTSK
jgi:hypothetical protein